MAGPGATTGSPHCGAACGDRADSPADGQAQLPQRTVPRRHTGPWLTDSANYWLTKHEVKMDMFTLGA
jgi:hypothetical protein